MWISNFYNYFRSISRSANYKSINNKLILIKYYTILIWELGNNAKQHIIGT